MANLGPVGDSTHARVKNVKGELGYSNNGKAIDFLLDFYETFKDQGAMESFKDNADALKAAIFALSAKPMLRKLQIKALREALDEAESGMQ